MKNESVSFRPEAVFKHRSDLAYTAGPMNVIEVVSFSKNPVAYRIDGLAAKVWLAIDGKRSLASIIHSVQRKAGLPETMTAQLQKDVGAFVKDLAKKNLIQGPMTTKKRPPKPVPRARKKRA